MADCTLLSVGRELLLGFTVDTNASYLASEVSALGYRITQCRTCDDELAQIVRCIRDLAEESDVLIITGGLGPTPDDLTRQAVAEACGTHLIYSDELMSQINQRFASMNRQPSESNRNQAFLPAAGGFLQNTCGTAPGVWCKLGKCTIYSMPGVPSEMKWMFSLSVAPCLVGISGGQCRYMRRLNICGIGESRIGEIISKALAQGWECEIGTVVDFGLITLRIMAHAGDENSAAKKCAPALDFFREQLGEYIFGEEDDTLPAVLLDNLKHADIKLSLAESCTGGMIASELVSVPGASEVLLEGIVSYSNLAKEKRLGVSPQTLEAFGAVSRETACEMARGAKEYLGADFSLAVTGIAGPGGGTTQKPVGMIWIAVASEKWVYAIRYDFPYSRYLFRRCATVFALDFLRRIANNLELPKGTEKCL